MQGSALLYKTTCFVNIASLQGVSGFLEPPGELLLTFLVVVDVDHWALVHMPCPSDVVHN